MKTAEINIFVTEEMNEFKKFLKLLKKYQGKSSSHKVFFCCSATKSTICPSSSSTFAGELTDTSPGEKENKSSKVEVFYT